MAAPPDDDRSARGLPAPSLPSASRSPDGPRITVVRFETLPARPPAPNRTRAAQPHVATVDGPAAFDQLGRIRPPHVRLAARALLAQIGLALVIALHVLGAQAVWLDWRGAGETPDVERFVVATVAVHVLCATSFLAWFYRAYANVRVFARTLYGPGWAILGWFVPILNLFRPLQIANDLMNRTEDGTTPLGSSLVLSWWLLWLAAPVASAAGAAGAVDDDVRTGLLLGTLGASSLAALLAIAIVRRVTRLQDSRLDARLAMDR